MEEEKNTITPEEEINYTTNTTDNESTPEEIDATKITEDTKIVLEEQPEEFVKPKKNLFLKILFGIIAFLLILLITGTILYFTGFFGPKEEIKKVEEPVTTTHEVTVKEEPAVVENNNPKFEIKDINSKKLNEQLANLTSKNISEEKKILEDEKKKEELLKQKAKEKEEEERKTELEDSMKKKGQHENLDNVKVKVGIEASSAGDKKNFEDNEIKNSTSNETLDNNKKLNKETSNKEFLLFINVAKIKGVLYKKYLDKVIAIDPNVKLCRDEKNRIEIYFGPFEKNEDRTELLNKLLKNKFTEAYPLEFTKEEFDKRCNY